jgi:hypothetical protein
MMFDPILCAKYVESLIHMDEVERALLVLDNVPAEYRDNPPENLALLRNQIVASLCTAHAYMSSGLDAKVMPEHAVPNLHHNLRGLIVEAEVKRYNAAGKIPHIVDVGPGEYWIPIGLLQLGFRFTYWDIAFDSGTQAAAHPMLGSVRQPKASPEQPQIFLGLEIIEHLPSPMDLGVECLRHCGKWPERVHLSTPHYTYDTREKDWRKPCGLPHLRAYTPLEFLDSAKKIFPGYEWQIYSSNILSLRGMRRDVVENANEPIVQPDAK